jgi:signal transduction histidine kinase
MRQVFYSMLSNSIKFARPHEPLQVRITSTFENFTEANNSSKTSYYRIEIRDNGVGFNDEYAERAFEMFRTLHTRDKYEGRGIGLAITKKIIEKHGGTIAATATPDQGATFTIRLPAGATI